MSSRMAAFRPAFIQPPGEAKKMWGCGFCLQLTRCRRTHTLLCSMSAMRMGSQPVLSVATQSAPPSGHLGTFKVHHFGRCPTSSKSSCKIPPLPSILWGIPSVKLPVNWGLTAARCADMSVLR